MFVSYFITNYNAEIMYNIIHIFTNLTINDRLNYQHFR